MSPTPQITPSDDAGAKLLNGHKGGATQVLAYMLLRSAFIAPALYLAGTRRRLVLKSVAASAGVTVFGLLFLKYMSKVAR